MAVKHQLFIGGETQEVVNFFDVTASALPFSERGKWSPGSSGGAPGKAAGESTSGVTGRGAGEFGAFEAVPLAFDLASVVPLPRLSPSRAIVSVLDSEGELVKRARLEAWGTRELPTASLLHLLYRQPGTPETDGAEAVVEFRTNSGTLTRWASEAQQKYEHLTFKLVWVEWPGAQATGAHAYFPESGERLSCPSPREIEKFVRFFGWVGDRGFNDSFFYVCPPVQSQKKI